jgi:peptide/nickel transport system permease protein
MSAATISLPIIARRNPLAAIGVVLIIVFVLCALFAPLLAPYDPAHISLPNRLLPPSSAHWCGTDELGRDICSRLVYGSRISLLVGSSVVLVSLFLGLIMGSIAGYYGGLIDQFFNVVLMNAFLSFPGILLAIAFVAFRGPGIFNLVLALSIGGWVGYARLIRAQVLAAREREFVEAARALGASDARALLRHILPNIIQPIIVQAAIGMAGAILAEATMSFLGLGVPPPSASWGAMLNDARSYLFDAPHLVLFPALAVMLAVLAFNFIGDALRDMLDPRSRIEAGL